MKKRKGNYLLSHEEFMLLQNIVDRYTVLFAYVKTKLTKRELISTNQIVEKYCISRQTIYRIQKAGILLPIFKHRTYYFDNDETRKFFKKYWGR